MSDNSTNTNLSLFCNKHFASIISFHLHNKGVRDAFCLPSCRRGGGMLDDWITFQCHRVNVRTELRIQAVYPGSDIFLPLLCCFQIMRAGKGRMENSSKMTDIGSLSSRSSETMAGDKSLDNKHNLNISWYKGSWNNRKTKMLSGKLFALEWAWVSQWT